jgi:bifunctional DNA-binding transcriptional regulator/antitoxin component of YhaV-PrlF toxin-antitoxin module
MTTEDYRAALAAAIKEYEVLGEQRRAIDDRMAQLGQTIGTLTRLLGLTPTVPLGLTDACRMILRGGQPMTPVEVRDRLRAIGIDVSKYANDLAAVHTILKRLNDSGELRFIPRGPGKHQYASNRPSTPIALEPDIIAFKRDATHEREAMQSTTVPVDKEEPPSRAPRTKQATRTR